MHRLQKRLPPTSFDHKTGTLLEENKLKTSNPFLEYVFLSSTEREREREKSCFVYAEKGGRRRANIFEKIKIFQYHLKIIVMLYR